MLSERASLEGNDDGSLGETVEERGGEFEGAEELDSHPHAHKEKLTNSLLPKQYFKKPTKQLPFDDNNICTLSPAIHIFIGSW